MHLSKFSSMVQGRLKQEGVKKPQRDDSSGSHFKLIQARFSSISDWFPPTLPGRDRPG